MIFDDVKVGDKFRDMITYPTTLTVTELTDRGFKYTCTPYSALPARMGMSTVTGGELYYKDHLYINWDVRYAKE